MFICHFALTDQKRTNQRLICRNFFISIFGRNNPVFTALFSNDIKKKSVGSLKNWIYYVVIWKLSLCLCWYFSLIFAWDDCSFYLRIQLFNTFVLSWVDRVITRTRSFNVSAPVEFIIQQFTDKLSIRFISQLIKGTSKFLQKSLKHCNGTIISVSFVLPVADVAPFILALNQNLL